MKKLIIALACCSVMVSCVKEEDKEIVDVSKTTYLMDGRWQLKGFTWQPDVNDSSQGTADQFTPMDGCDKDDTWHFFSRNQLTEHEMVKCNLTQPDSLVYSYALTNDDKYIRIWSIPEDPDNSTILKGDVKFPSIDTFVVTYTAPHPQDEDLTSRYVKTYVKNK